MEIKNIGSVARDHLANERTFLAWIRTGFALIAIGLAFSEFTARNTAVVYGLFFVSLGFIFLIYSIVRYYDVKAGLDKGVFILNDPMLYTLVSIALILSLGAFIIIINSA